MAGSERGKPGGISALITIIDEHKPALRYDFRHYLGLSLDKVILDPTHWGVVRDYVLEIARETGSHLYANAAGWTLAGSQADVANILLSEWYYNVNRAEKSEPVDLPKPWVMSAKSDVTPNERQQIEARLKQYSMFA